MSVSSNSDKSMLGGCCICLDERGWDENPLVYCDGQSCPVAVHQACYGIVTVPSGPWFCRRCELHDNPIQLQCVLCPHQDGALKKTDNDKWAHVVCALYIPEVTFGNVSTMEPIVTEKIPDERYSKTCYVCEENNRSGKSFGACMNCAKSGCSKNFHVTCAQMAGLLCEEAGGSNTTKYCGYCNQHFSRNKKGNPFKSLACSKVYKLSSPVHETSDTKDEGCSTKSNPDTDSDSEFQNNLCDENSQTKRTQPISEQNTDSVLQNASSISTSTLSSLAEVASSALKKAQEFNALETAKKSNNMIKEEGSKKMKKCEKRKTVKAMEKDGKKTKKQKLNAVQHQTKLEKPRHNIDPSLLEDVGYAMAPKHSVVSLSSFGASSIEPSHPSDIGETKPVPTTHFDECDGLSNIEKIVDQQRGDIMNFFQEFGTTPDVSQLLHSLQELRDENNQLESAVDKMTHRRDQLMAIKARLSVPLKSPQFTRVCPSTADANIAALTDTKQFVPASHSQHYGTTYPYFKNQ